MTVAIKRSNDNAKKLVISISITLDAVIDSTVAEEGFTLDIHPDDLNKKVSAGDLLKDFEDYSSCYTRTDKKMVSACLRQFRLFLADDKAEEFDHKMCEKFWEHLQDNLNGNTPANYFKRFRSFLDTCVVKGLLDENPAKDIKLHYSDFMEKVSLEPKEIERLEGTPCRNKELKHAFLFSCFSGLRWCDINALTYENIDISQKSMSILQRKVKSHSSKAFLKTYLNDSALALLEPDCTKGKVFQLPSYSYSYEILQDWFRDAGINKHISFHNARHSFVSNLIEKGVDLKTVADLAGHSSTKYTERYVHNSEKRLRECVGRISL